MKKLVEEYNNRHLDDFTVQVLDEVTKQLNELLKDIQKDKEHFKELGISFEEKAFYDILVSCAQKFHFENQYPDDKMKDLAKKVKSLVDDKTKYTDWDQRIDVKAEMEESLKEKSVSIVEEKLLDLLLPGTGKKKSKKE